ncbi:MAG: hypothetical protein JW811_05395 [Clostridiales bacterium]|nr:hypothetical protein [Clostridiales bacterium]
MTRTRECRRCPDENTQDGMRLREILGERIRLLPEDEKASGAEYAQRLSLCESCDQLNSGTCMQCGCYVELRAAKRRMHCAHPKPKW